MSLRMDVPGLWFDRPRILDLRRDIQRPRAEDGFWAWYAVRRVSIYVTLLLSRTRITPNQITVLGTIVGTAGGIVWAVGEHWSFLLGCLLLQVMFLLDAVDGELARIKNLKSPMGAYLDILGHYLMDYCMIIGMGLGLSRAFGEVVIYGALGMVVVHLGDELLRDVLLKARVSSGRIAGLDQVHKTFSLFGSVGRLGRTMGGSIVGSPSLFHWVGLFSLVDLAFGSHFWKLGFFLLWGAAETLRFVIRFRRILLTAFREEMAV